MHTKVIMNKLSQKNAEYAPDNLCKIYRVISNGGISIVQAMRSLTKPRACIVMRKLNGSKVGCSLLTKKMNRYTIVTQRNVAIKSMICFCSRKYFINFIRRSPFPIHQLALIH